MKTIKELEEEGIKKSFNAGRWNALKDVLGLMKEIEKSNNGCWAFNELKERIEGKLSHNLVKLRQKKNQQRGKNKICNVTKLVK